MPEEQQPHEAHESGAGILAVFGRQLKLLRVAAGIDRARLRALTGYSASTIATFEQGGGCPRRSSSTRRTTSCGLTAC